MTRMPDRFRKPHATVLDLLRQNFADFPLLSVSANPWQLLYGLAHQAGINELVTWSFRHFKPHGFPGLAIVRPNEG